MPLVRRIESCGSRSGKTLKPITISECGELPSQRQILAKRMAERQEMVDLKKDPLQVTTCYTLIREALRSSGIPHISGIIGKPSKA